MHKKLVLFLSAFVDDAKMDGRKQNMDSMWKTRHKEVNLEDPTPLIDPLYLGCTERDAKVDPQAVQSKTELFKKLTTTKEADEKDETNENICWKRSLLGAHDTEGHAEKCVDRYCHLAKNVSSFQQVATPCMYDHLIPLEDYETTGELFAARAQIVLKCMYLARIGGPDLVWWHDQ